LYDIGQGNGSGPFLNPGARTGHAVLGIRLDRTPTVVSEFADCTIRGQTKPDFYPKSTLIPI